MSVSADIAYQSSARLLSGLVRCAQCGGPVIVVDKDHFGCPAYRSNRSCDNGRKIGIDRLKKATLDSLKIRLLTDDHFVTFTDEYRRAHKDYQKGKRRQTKAVCAELRFLDPKIGKLVTAITEGTDTPTMRTTLVELEDRKAQITRDQSETDTEQEAIVLLPNLPDTFRRHVERLEAARSIACAQNEREQAPDWMIMNASPGGLEPPFTA